MIHEETIQKLLELKLHAMAAAARELVASPPGNALSYQEALGILVEKEWLARGNRRLSKRLREARLPCSAMCLEDVHADPARGIDKAVLRGLGVGQWIRAKQNVIVLGPTGVGKTYIGGALAHCACRLGFKALFVRTTRFLSDLAVARGDGSIGGVLQKISKVDVLVLDDFLLAPMRDSERRDLLEVLEDRYDRTSTVITSQLPTKSWHEALSDPTIADAICDRVVHNAHVLTLRGQSIRKKKGLGPELV